MKTQKGKGKGKKDGYTTIRVKKSTLEALQEVCKDLKSYETWILQRIAEEKEAEEKR